MQPKKVEHYRFKSDGKNRIKGLKHNQNNYQSRPKGWIDRFKGVTTKYLDNSLSWFLFLDIIKHRNDVKTVTKMIIERCLFSAKTIYEGL